MWLRWRLSSTSKVSCSICWASWPLWCYSWIYVYITHLRSCLPHTLYVIFNSVHICYDMFGMSEQVQVLASFLFHPPASEGDVMSVSSCWLRSFTNIESLIWWGLCMLTCKVLSFSEDLSKNIDTICMYGLHAAIHACEKVSADMQCKHVSVCLVCACFGLSHRSMLNSSGRQTEAHRPLSFCWAQQCKGLKTSKCIFQEDSQPLTRQQKQR